MCRRYFVHFVLVSQCVQWTVIRFVSCCCCCRCCKLFYSLFMYTVLRRSDAFIISFTEYGFICHLHCAKCMPNTLKLTLNFRFVLPFCLYVNKTVRACSTPRLLLLFLSLALSLTLSRSNQHWQSTASST